MEEEWRVDLQDKRYEEAPRRPPPRGASCILIDGIRGDLEDCVM